MAGFEPTASAHRTQRSAGLSYTLSWAGRDSNPQCLSAPGLQPGERPVAQPTLGQIADTDQQVVKESNPRLAGWSRAPCHWTNDLSNLQCAGRDSNPHCCGSKPHASCRWATRAHRHHWPRRDSNPHALLFGQPPLKRSRLPSFATRPLSSQPHGPGGIRTPTPLHGAAGSEPATSAKFPSQGLLLIRSPTCTWPRRDLNSHAAGQPGLSRPCLPFPPRGRGRESVRCREQALTLAALSPSPSLRPAGFEPAWVSPVRFELTPYASFRHGRVFSIKRRSPGGLSATGAPRFANPARALGGLPSGKIRQPQAWRKEHHLYHLNHIIAWTRPKVKRRNFHRTAKCRSTWPASSTTASDRMRSSAFATASVVTLLRPGHIWAKSSGREPQSTTLSA